MDETPDKSGRNGTSRASATRPRKPVRPGPPRGTEVTIGGPGPGPSVPETWPWIVRTAPIARLDELACPTIGLMELLGRRWSVPILHRLDLSAPIRPGALERVIPGISRKELTRRLRELEALGWVRREVFAEVPPRVEYSLTDEGRAMLVPIRALSEWAEAHAASIASARSAQVAED